MLCIGLLTIVSSLRIVGCYLSMINHDKLALFTDVEGFGCHPASKFFSFKVVTDDSGVYF